jgi:hypothetical protein
MEFTQEEQRLLKGDCLIRTENGEFQVTNAGMGDATTAPDYMKRRIIEIRLNTSGVQKNVQPVLAFWDELALIGLG